MAVNLFACEVADVPEAAETLSDHFDIVVRSCGRALERQEPVRQH